MKKIKIITFHSELNYGAVLQAYALQKAIRNEGGEPYFSDVSLRNFKQPAHRSLKEIVIQAYAHVINRPKERQFIQFRKNEFKTSKDDKENCDLIICGSDQIWNPEITNGLQPYFFGVGQRYKKKVSYAASCGDTSTISNDMDLLREYLSDFSLISVREEKTRLYLNQQGIECKTVVDPTLLICQDEWLRLVHKSKSQKPMSKYIFVYDLEGTQTFSDTVNAITTDTNVPVVTLRHRAHYYNEIMRFPKASPYDFLFLIYNAEYVVSNSFHALIFSYIFQKKAYIVPHTHYAERMVSFLDNFNVKLNEINTYIDFSKVDMTYVNKLISDSIRFLKDSMEME